MSLCYGWYLLAVIADSEPIIYFLMKVTGFDKYRLIESSKSVQ